jgi:hypothetical protein
MKLADATVLLYNNNGFGLMKLFWSHIKRHLLSLLTRQVYHLFSQTPSNNFIV